MPSPSAQLQHLEQRFDIKKEELATTSEDDTSDEEGQQAGNTPAGGGHKHRDKEWAALTTWLRMNLHQPRTLKKQVLFVGRQDGANKAWVFDLNPALSWDDVSLETKLRLKTLPEETELAFSRKYPKRPSCEWGKKTQKYRPAGIGGCVTVPLRDMICTLRDIFLRYEGAAGSTSSTIASASSTPPLPVLQPQQQQPSGA